MKNLHLILLPLFSCFLFAQCTKNQDNKAILEVKFNEWSHSGDVHMQLTGIIEDSRCPVHQLDTFLCVSQGKADGLVATEINGASHVIQFSIMGLCDTSLDTCGSFIDTLGYQFQFLSLKPYPDGNIIINDDYVLSVKVSKK